MSDSIRPTNSDRLFVGSIPQLYESHMVPLIFEPYAVDLAARVSALRPMAVLEVAAGPGVVTRHMAAATCPNQPISNPSFKAAGHGKPNPRVDLAFRADAL